VPVVVVALLDIQAALLEQVVLVAAEQAGQIQLLLVRLVLLTLAVVVVARVQI